MDNPAEVSINHLDPPEPGGFSGHDGQRSELEYLRQSYRSLQSRSAAMEENLAQFRQEKDEFLSNEADLNQAIAKLTSERDSLREEISRFEETVKGGRVDEFSRKLDEEMREKEELKNEVEVYRERIQKLEIEREENNQFMLKCLESLRSAKDCLYRIVEGIVTDEEKDEIGREKRGVMGIELELGEESSAFSEEIKSVTRLTMEVEEKVNSYKELRKKEKRELEDSVVSLTEENRDINSLLRVALVEKEAVEKSLNKLKGNSEQKRVAILQIAERGLQRVGFGFMMGGGGNEQSAEPSSGSAIGTKSDGSESEEEAASLASLVERIMKNLRLEITQLRRSLSETRSDSERLQSLTEKQAQTIAENKLYIQELEDRERLLAQNVEELLTEIKETEAEVARWREACQLEVEAGRKEILECEELVAVLKQELQKTKAALDISNGKLKLKEELASAAMAAQAAAEKSLLLADSRSMALRERIEELTRQLEEAEKRERDSHKIRHLCWPWRLLKMNTSSITNTGVQNVKRMLPEMQALLH